MIKDEVKVKFMAGKGGDGAAKFAAGAKKYPTGGIGGKGADLYIEGTFDKPDLKHINPDTIFKAEDGQEGGTNNQRGRDGKDLIVRLPVGTEIYNESGELIYAVKQRGEKHLLLEGGMGGLGNYYFRRGFEGRFDKANPGKPGGELTANLIFKLAAQVVFIGLPNAGKSSMLNAMTNAHVKVGNYPFTTLSPHLGRLSDITLMDLPGLIEGTSTGKGLGSGFMKHTESAELIAHFLSLESGDLLKDYKIIRKELQDISEDLYNKKEVVVLTKSDMFDEDQIAEKLKQLSPVKSPKVICTAFDNETLAEVEKVFRENLK